MNLVDHVLASDNALGHYRDSRALRAINAKLIFAGVMIRCYYAPTVRALSVEQCPSVHRSVCLSCVCFLDRRLIYYHITTHLVVLVEATSSKQLF